MDQKDEDTASHGDEDLAHDDKANLDVWLAEVYHQAQAKRIQWNGDIEQPLEAPSTTYEVPNDEEENSGHDLERAVDIAGLGDRKVAYHLQEGGEIAVPAVVRDLVRRINKAGADDCPIEKEFVLQKRCRSPVCLVHAESNKHKETDDDHRDDVVCLPTIGRRCCEIEWEEEYSEAAGEENNTRH